MKDKPLAPKERSRQRKLMKLEKEKYFSFNQPKDNVVENRDYLIKELERMYPHGDMTKTKEERDFRTNTPVKQTLHKPDYRRSDMYTKVKGIPRAPFIPSHVPKLDDDGSEVDIIGNEDTGITQDKADPKVQEKNGNPVSPREWTED